MLVQDVMSTPVACVSPRESLAHASTLMKQTSLHHLVVIDGTAVVGVVSSSELEPAVARFPDFLVSDLMSPSVVTADATMTLEQAASRMRGRGLGSLPVLDGNSLVGLVTVSDLLERIGRKEEP